jgi:hypothetical protein
MRFYVYQYLTEDGIPYYIGKGSGNRMNVKHTTVALPTKERRMIIQSGLTNNEAKQLEAELITKYKRKVDGGILDNIKINQWACAVGWQHSTETKQKISQGNLGKVRTEDHKKNYSHPKSEEHASNIQSAVKNLWADLEYKQKRLAKVMETRRRNGLSK